MLATRYSSCQALENRHIMSYCTTSPSEQVLLVAFKVGCVHREIEKAMAMPVRTASGRGLGQAITLQDAANGKGSQWRLLSATGKQTLHGPESSCQTLWCGLSENKLRTKVLTLLLYSFSRL